MIYLDTSALVKRFVTEPGSELVHSLVSASGPIATAKISYIETHAALARHYREGTISKTRYLATVQQFERDWLAYVRIDLQDDILRLARDIVRRRPLRGYDAIHLASALSIRQALDEEVTFAAADRRLLQAAASEGLQPLDVEAAANT